MEFVTSSSVEHVAAGKIGVFDLVLPVEVTVSVPANARSGHLGSSATDPSDSSSSSSANSSASALHQLTEALFAALPTSIPGMLDAARQEVTADGGKSTARVVSLPSVAFVYKFLAPADSYHLLRDCTRVSNEEQRGMKSFVTSKHVLHVRAFPAGSDLTGIAQAWVTTAAS